MCLWQYCKSFALVLAESAFAGVVCAELHGTHDGVSNAGGDSVDDDIPLSSLRFCNLTMQPFSTSNFEHQV